MEDDMADKTPATDSEGKGNKKFPIIVISVVVVVVIAIILTILIMRENSPGLQVKKELVEYVVPEKMYQLRDGSYLRLGFSIVVDKDKYSEVEEIIQDKSPGRLPDGIHMLVGNKTRDDLISGSYKRDAFSRELKKVLEEQVFGPYNKDKAPRDVIQVKDVLISDFVTQSG